MSVGDQARVVSGDAAAAAHSGLMILPFFGCAGPDARFTATSYDDQLTRGAEMDQKLSLTSILL
jgi:hypothetical protein